MTVGMVRTVLGDVEPAALGVTHTHEHMLITFGRWRAAGESGQIGRVSDDPRARQPITLETSGWVRRYSASHPDNRLLDDESLAIDELRRFKVAGGGAIVDATNPDLKRDPEALVRISQATGVHIVMGSGHYVGDNHPLDMDDRDEEQLCAEIVEDITRGCDGTSIKAGIIGEIGCTAPMMQNERKMLRAAARAQRITGAALLIHPGRAVTAPLEAMQVAIEAGADPTRTIMSHLDRTLFDQRDMIALGRTGCYLEFDLFGQESSYYPLSPIDMPNDATRIDHLQRLIAEGFGDKLLIAHDICHKTNLVKYGGDGYAHILENVVPVMRRKGMREDEIDAILVHNPARVLPLVATAP
jgi:phosphotriesterase-related protein